MYYSKIIGAQQIWKWEQHRNKISVFNTDNGTKTRNFMWCHVKNGEITNSHKWNRQARESDTTKNMIFIGFPGREKNQSLFRMLKLKRIGKDVTCTEGLKLNPFLLLLFRKSIMLLLLRLKREGEKWDAIKPEFDSLIFMLKDCFYIRWNKK